MTICYNKLWKLLIDKNMKKKDLRLATGMSTTALAKLGKNQHVSTEILTKICEVLDCDFCDIIELVKEENHDLLCFPLKNLVISGVSAYQILKPYVLSLVFSLTG